MKKHSAFSLIELSIVILIIGILVAGVTQSSRLIAKMRLSTARSLTQSSPVSSVKNLIAWYETTSESSFDADYDNDAVIVTWKDINPQVSYKNDLTVFSDATTGESPEETAPKYKENGINSLPALTFDASLNNIMKSSSNIRIDDATYNFTVFAVFTQPSTATSVVFQSGWWTGSNCGTNIMLHLNAEATGQSGTGRGGSVGAVSNCDYTRLTTSGASTLTINSPTFVTLTATGSSVNIYKNGGSSLATETAESSFRSGTMSSFSSSPIIVGGYGTNNGSTAAVGWFTGNLGELIFFDRVLKTEERQAIEKYLGQKWGIKIGS